MQAIHLNGHWRFLAVAAGDQTDYSSLDQDVSAWNTMNLPQNWALGGLDHVGAVWFRYRFEMPVNDECSVWWLEFFGVDYQCDVWLNAEYVGQHKGYFDKFRFDVTDKLMLETNILMVRVFNIEQAESVTGVFDQHLAQMEQIRLAPLSYNTGGIWREVCLTPYDCNQPPQAEDWFEPLAAPFLHFDTSAKLWRWSDTPVFLRGCTYMPTRFLSAMQRSDFERDLNLMRDANINTVRVYGHVLPDVFYDLCDKLQMYVWQDFPASQAEASRQVEAMLHHLGHHPCIAIWGVPDEGLAALVRGLDPARYVVMTGSQNGSPEGQGLTELPLHSTLPLVNGLLAAPNLPTLLDVFGSEEKALAAKEISMNLNTEGGLQVAVNGSQDLQARHIKYALEFYRVRKNEGAQGVFYHTLVDHLAALSGSVLDHRRQPKSGYWALRLAMQPVLPIAAVPLEYVPVLPSGIEISFPLIIVNDTPERLTGWTCKVSMTGWVPSTETDSGQTYMHHWNKVYSNLTIDACSLRDLGKVKIPPLPKQPREYHLVLQMFNINDETRDAVVNTYIFEVRR